MKVRSLKTQILFSFFIIITAVGALSMLLGLYVIENDIVKRVQKEVKRAINTAESFYENEIYNIRNVIKIADSAESLFAAKENLELDYVYQVPIAEKDKVKSEIALSAFSGIEKGGSRIVTKEELNSISLALLEKAKIDIKNTPKTKPINKKFLDDALAIEYAVPVFDDGGSVAAVRYAGKLINKDFKLVDKIRDFVFEDELYKNKPVGTVTIFLGDVRIATNVLNEKNERALGTRVSDIVYNKVIKGGGNWQAKAFVVTDWYITVYKPIKDIRNNVIGILYVGILEKPFSDLKLQIIFAFLLILFITGIFAILFSYIFASGITKYVKKMVEATENIARGNLSHRINEDKPIDEFNHLLISFNTMAEKLNERDVHLKISREDLEILNKRYLDLVGFVSHELKGILASIVLNIYLLKNGLVGAVNENQKKVLKSISDNLDYLAATVKNFLNLSRIEKGEMTLSKTDISVKEDIFDIAVESFTGQATDKEMEVINKLEPNLKVFADSSLMQIVANNLITNAIKYGKRKGKIIIASKKNNDIIEVEVYNDGNPISFIDKEKLFKKFSRLHYIGTEKEKGTGIGLFITKEIIEKHGGKVWFEPKENGNSFKFILPTAKTLANA